MYLWYTLGHYHRIIERIFVVIASMGNTKYALRILKKQTYSAYDKSPEITKECQVFLIYKSISSLSIMKFLLFLLEQPNF